MAINLQVTYPQAGDEIKRGCSYIIRWKVIGSMDTDVKIELYESGGSTLVETIIAVTENCGFYIWNVTPNLTLRTDAYIKITTVDTTYTDSGTDFEIVSESLFSDIANLEEFNRVGIVELEAGYLFGTWVITGTGNSSYYTTYIYGEISRLQFNGVNLVRCYSTAYCEATEDTFFHDIENQKVYVNIGEDPNGTGNILNGFTWVPFTTKHESGYTCDFIPAGALRPAYYLPFLDSSAIPPISQKVSEYYTRALTTHFGNLKFIHDAWFWIYKTIYTWGNKNIRVKMGEIGFEYDEFITIFQGGSKKLSFSDKQVSVGTKDKRAVDLVTIPTAKFDLTTYPNLEDGEENKVIPILFGTKAGIICIRVNTSTNVFKISDTVFNGTTYALEAIDTVYQAGVEIFLTSGYTVDLNAGEITLINDPGDDAITADVQGIKCEYDFSDGSATGDFSENTADILFFILTELNNIPVGKIDLESFDDLQGKRTQKIGVYLKIAKKTKEIIRLCQASTVFHFLPLLNGLYAVRYYDRATPENAPHFYDEDYTNFKLEEDTEACFKTVVIKYNQNPETDVWEEVFETDPETGYKYQEEDTLTIFTLLTDATEAGVLATFYQGLINQPRNIINTELSPKILSNIPSDKAFFSRTVTGDDGIKRTVLDEEVYLLLSIRKGMKDARSKVVGILDTQVGGAGGHADVLHVDWTVSETHNDHADTEHVDVEHEDSDHDDHANVVYTDNHSDHEESYVDHDDDGHSDRTVPHGDYTDIVAHQDYDDATHSNVTHQDGHDDYNDITYDDQHGNVTHVDSEI